MAEGDKVVPSGGNPQLDPTAKGALNSTLGRTSGALNSSLGVTKGALSSSLGVTKGSLSGGKISGSLSGNRWIKNQSGLLIRNDDVEVERDVYRSRSQSRGGPSSSVEEVMYRGQQDIKDSMQGKWNQYRKDLRASKKAEKSGSPDGEGMTDADSFRRQQQQGKQPIQRDKGAAFSPSYGTLNFNSPIMKGAATMAMACLPFNGVLPRIVGPFLVSINNHDGGFVQTNIAEATTKGRNVNAVDTETPADGS